MKLYYRNVLGKYVFINGNNDKRRCIRTSINHNFVYSRKDPIYYP